jgi:hypothetical protein
MPPPSRISCTCHGLECRRAGFATLLRGNNRNKKASKAGTSLSSTVAAAAAGGNIEFECCKFVTGQGSLGSKFISRQAAAAAQHSFLAAVTPQMQQTNAYFRRCCCSRVTKCVEESNEYRAVCMHSPMNESAVTVTVVVTVIHWQCRETRKGYDEPMWTRRRKRMPWTWMWTTTAYN